MSLNTVPFKTLPAIALGLVCTAANAQEPSTEAASVAGHWGLTASLSVLSLDSTAATSQYIDDRAWGLGLSANYWQPKYLLSFGMDFYSYDDQGEFSQPTVDDNGRTGTNSSDASAFGGFIAYGPYWKLGRAQTEVVFAQLGFSHIFESERAIPNCSDCYTEDIDIDAGPFLKAGYVHIAGGHQLGLQTLVYLGGDGLKNTFSLTWGIGF